MPIYFYRYSRAWRFTIKKKVQRNWKNKILTTKYRSIQNHKGHKFLMRHIRDTSQPGPVSVNTRTHTGTTGRLKRGSSKLFKMICDTTTTYIFTQINRQNAWYIFFASIDLCNNSEPKIGRETTPSTCYSNLHENWHLQCNFSVW